MTLSSDSPNPFLGPRLWAARALWIGVAALAIWLWGLSSIRFLGEPFHPAAEVSDPTVFTLEDLDILRGLGLPEALATLPALFFTAFGAVYFVLGGWIFWRRSGEWMAMLVSFVLVFLGSIVLGYTWETLHRAYPGWLPAFSALLFLGVMSLALLLYLFPDGQFVPRWTRLLPVPLGALLLLFVLPTPKEVGQTGIILAFLGISVTGIYARVYRYRRFSTSVQRQQDKWVGLGLATMVAGMTLWSISFFLFPPDEPGEGRIYFLMTLLPVAAIMTVLLPVCIAIAILRHRLWEIDTLINRTVVYGPLSGILMGVYVGFLRLFQALFVRFTGEQSDFSILFSTMVLAAVFWPMRLRLQALADRYFKDVPDPVRGLTAFENQLRSMTQLIDTGYISRRLLDEAVAAFHAESGAVFLRQGDDLRLAQSAGAWGGNAKISIPLEHGGIQLGQLSLGPRPKGREYGAQDIETLRRMTESAAPAFDLSLRAR
ncbi:MAG: hypothetical protein HY666_00085 [Chloroflexi bacterium]|nr:hypothetical protein [Chloroflexota bacterium]